MATTSCRKSSSVYSSPTESRLSDRKLKPLPPDPFRHQHSAIAHAVARFGTPTVVKALSVATIAALGGAYARSIPDVRRRRGCRAGAVQLALAGMGGRSKCTDDCADYRN